MDKGHFFHLFIQLNIHEAVRIYDIAYGIRITQDFLLFFLDALYDCASLYSKSYKISGEYKLPKDEFLGTPELSVSYP